MICIFALWWTGDFSRMHPACHTHTHTQISPCVISRNSTLLPFPVLDFTLNWRFLLIKQFFFRKTCKNSKCTTLGMEAYNICQSRLFSREDCQVKNVYLTLLMDDLSFLFKQRWCDDIPIKKYYSGQPDGFRWKDFMFFSWVYSRYCAFFQYPVKQDSKRVEALNCADMDANFEIKNYFGVCIR